MVEIKRINLQTRREVTLLGGVIIDGENVVSLDATVSSDPNVPTNYTERITNSRIYYENREEARQQIEDFRETVHQTEDELVSQSTEEDTSENPEESEESKEQEEIEEEPELPEETEDEPTQEEK